MKKWFFPTLLKPHANTDNTSFWAHFWLFFLLNIIFFCSQYAITLSNPHTFTQALTLPNIVYFELLLSFVIHLGLYSLLSLLQTCILPNSNSPLLHRISQDAWMIIIWSLSITTIITANTFIYPHSVFSQLFALNETLNTTVLYLSLSGLSFLTFIALLPHLCMVLVIVIPLGLLLTYHKEPSPIPSSQLKNIRPNVVIIGIDSLSQSAISQNQMPHLSKLLEESVYFENALSPLARTYPAWISILTGLYPKNHGAIENLVPKEDVKSHRSIAWLLQKEGYKTIYATDEKRFSNIDETFGFQTIVGPKFGVNDIILGTFNDFPLSNLFMHSFLGASFFPYNYTNRASHFSYYPERFDVQLKTALTHRKSDAPIFLAVHFTLPHWPYTWAKSPDFYGKNKIQNQYQAALKGVDHQVANLVYQLNQNHLLDNSLLIFLSDHGESLKGAHSRPLDMQKYQGHSHHLKTFFKTNTDTSFHKSAGHGSDLLSPNQYQSLLAFQLRKENKRISLKKEISTRVALIDIAPTIYAYLHKNPPKMDGISLLSALINPSTVLPERPFYLESGMFPNHTFSKEKLLVIAKQLFQIESHTGELQIKKDQLPFIQNQKLYGIIQGDWLLALYPHKKKYLPVIFQLKTGLWSDEPNGVFFKKSPFSQLLENLEQFNQIKFTLVD